MVSLAVVKLAKLCPQEVRANDTTYGYSDKNPLKIKVGNHGKSYDYFLNFIDNLTTDDGQSLVLWQHKTIHDPNYVETATVGNNIQTGIFKKARYGVDGLIEQYHFITAATRDTITLYVNVKERKTLNIPYGLKLKTP